MENAFDNLVQRMLIIERQIPSYGHFEKIPFENFELVQLKNK
jgi:hypothetical protein